MKRLLSLFVLFQSTSALAGGFEFRVPSESWGLFQIHINDQDVNHQGGNSFDFVVQGTHAFEIDGRVFVPVRRVHGVIDADPQGWGQDIAKWEVFDAGNELIIVAHCGLPDNFDFWQMYFLQNKQGQLLYDYHEVFGDHTWTQPRCRDRWDYNFDGVVTMHDYALIDFSDFSLLDYDRFSYELESGSSNDD